MDNKEIIADLKKMLAQNGIRVDDDADIVATIELSLLDRESKNLELESEMKLREDQVTYATNKCLELKKELEDIRKENENLLRIHRERSNALRKMKPKKQLVGYRFIGKLMSSDIPVDEYDDDGNQRHIETWMGTIETPYASKLPYEQAQKHIFTDLKGNDGNGIFEKLGLKWTNLENGDIWKGRLSNLYEKEISDLAIANYVFDYNLQNNIKSHYWEIVIRTTKYIETWHALIEGTDEDEAIE